MKEILKNLVETTTLPEDSYLDQDAEILEIEVNLTHPSHLQLLHSQKFIFMLGFKS